MFAELPETVEDQRQGFTGKLNVCIERCDFDRISKKIKSCFFNQVFHDFSHTFVEKNKKKTIAFKTGI